MLNLTNPEPLHTFQEYFIAKKFYEILYYENMIKGFPNMFNDIIITDEIKQLYKRISNFELKYKLR
jgi:hypothetical protein